MKRRPSCRPETAKRLRASRAAGLRKSGKRLAEFRIVLCGEYSSTCRRVRWRTPHAMAGHRARLDLPVPSAIWRMPAARPELRHENDGNTARHLFCLLFLRTVGPSAFFPYICTSAKNYNHAQTDPSLACRMPGRPLPIGRVQRQSPCTPGLISWGPSWTSA